MKKGYLWLALVLVIAFSAQSANAVLMNFEDLDPGDSYGEPNSFYTSGVEILVGVLYPYDGGNPISGGEVYVGNGGLAGVTGNELVLNDVNLRFLLAQSGYPSSGIALAFGYDGGEVNLGVNGSRKEYLSIYDIPAGENIGGADIMVVFNGDFGAMMVINGNIQSFLIGGELLAVDSVFATDSVPEPTTIVLLGLGGLILLKKKRGDK